MQKAVAHCVSLGYLCLRHFIQSCHVGLICFQPTMFIIKIAVCHLCFPLAELTPFWVEEGLKGFSLRKNGLLRVKRSGYYYIYAQVFFEPYPEGPRSRNRVALAVNGRTVSLMQKGLEKGRSDYGTLFTGAVKYLKRGRLHQLEDRVSYQAVVVRGTHILWSV